MLTLASHRSVFDETTNLDPPILPNHRIGYKRSRQLVLAGTVPSKQIGCRRLISAHWVDLWLQESTLLITSSQDTGPDSCNHHV